uniref:Uncharacterized protein n=1 Tax=Rhizophora mucronata TaxID=61149 RepID=A0A2P2N876_RHIMU
MINRLYLFIKVEPGPSPLNSNNLYFQTISAIFFSHDLIADIFNNIQSLH